MPHQRLRLQQLQLAVPGLLQNLNARLDTPDMLLTERRSALAPSPPTEPSMLALTLLLDLLASPPGTAMPVTLSRMSLSEPGPSLSLLALLAAASRSGCRAGLPGEQMLRMRSMMRASSGPIAEAEPGEKGLVGAALRRLLWGVAR
jgi:hypothetical protein